jgi:hypothetical protein
MAPKPMRKEDLATSVLLTSWVLSKQCVHSTALIQACLGLMLLLKKARADALCSQTIGMCINLFFFLFLDV